jgi:hypothetical protein
MADVVRDEAPNYVKSRCMKKFTQLLKNTVVSALTFLRCSPPLVIKNTAWFFITGPLLD